MNLSQIETNLIGLLEETTQVTQWDSIQFSMLPTDGPKGYVQLSQISYGALVSSSWLVGIGIASQSLDGLRAQIYSILEAIEVGFYYPSPCLAGGGTVSLDGPIQVEIPDSYANQSGISQTTGFRTAVTFELTISAPR